MNIATAFDEYSNDDRCYILRHVETYSRSICQHLTHILRKVNVYQAFGRFWEPLKTVFSCHVRWRVKWYVTCLRILRCLVRHSLYVFAEYTNFSYILAITTPLSKSHSDSPRSKHELSSEETSTFLRPKSDFPPSKIKVPVLAGFAEEFDNPPNLRKAFTKLYCERFSLSSRSLRTVHNESTEVVILLSW